MGKQKKDKVHVRFKNLKKFEDIKIDIKEQDKKQNELTNIENKLLKEIFEKNNKIKELKINIVTNEADLSKKNRTMQIQTHLEKEIVNHIKIKNERENKLLGYTKDAKKMKDKIIELENNVSKRNHSIKKNTLKIRNLENKIIQLNAELSGKKTIFDQNKNEILKQTINIDNGNKMISKLKNKFERRNHSIEENIRCIADQKITAIN